MRVLRAQLGVLVIAASLRCTRQASPLPQPPPTSQVLVRGIDLLSKGDVWGGDLAAPLADRVISRSVDVELLTSSPDAGGPGSGQPNVPHLLLPWPAIETGRRP